MKSPMFPAWQMILACLAGWIHPEQQQRNEFLQTETDILREMLGKKRLRFTDDQRRRLALKAKEVGRKGLMEMGV